MSTTGHESEAINVGGLKASLQKMKTDIVDPKYVKPSTGIPKSDLASDVQTSLGKADTALQTHQDISGKADKSATVSTVAYDTTNKRLTKTINGNTTDVVTALKIAQDAGALLLNPIELSSLSHDYTFKQNDCIMVGSVLYKCTVTSTTKPPFNFVFDANNKIVVDRINGVDSVVCDSLTLNTGWEVLLDLSDRYYLEQRLLSKADKATTLAGYGITDAYTKTQIDALTRHTRLTDFDLNVLKQAVAAQNLEKYGLKVGDQKTINGRTYVIAGLNPMKGTHAYTCTSNHVGLIVIPHTTHEWNASGETYTGADNRGPGYINSDLHYYLKNTLLPLVQTDLGSGNLLAHYKLLTSAVNQDSYNKSGWYEGCSGGWTWENGYIAALSEMQVYGGTVCSSSYFDTGEADQQLEVFQHYKHTEIFGDEYPWLRDMVSQSAAAMAYNNGLACPYPSASACYVAALVLFH